MKAPSDYQRFLFLKRFPTARECKFIVKNYLKYPERVLTEKLGITCKRMAMIKRVLKKNGFVFKNRKKEQDRLLNERMNNIKKQLNIN